MQTIYLDNAASTRPAEAVLSAANDVAATLYGNPSSVHGAGGRLCIQLCHHGKVAGVDTAEGRPLLVPSTPVPGFSLDALVDNPRSELIRLATATQGRAPTYRVADEDDLAWVVGQFAAAAGRAMVSVSTVSPAWTIAPGSRARVRTNAALGGVCDR